MKQNLHEMAGQTVILTTSGTTSPEIDISGFDSGMIYCGSGVTAVTLTYFVSEKAGGTYLAAQDSTGTPVTQTVAASKAFPIPAAVFGAGSMRIQGNAASTIFVSLKT